MLKNIGNGSILVGVLFSLFTPVTHANTQAVPAADQEQYNLATLLPNALSAVAVLAGTTITNAGATTVRGDVDVSPGTATTGFPPGVIINGQARSGALAAAAHSQAQGYYNSLIAQPCPAANNLSGQDLGGMTLAPGVYCFNSSASINGTLTLNGARGSTYIFQIGSTLITGAASKVRVRGGVEAIDVNWAVGSSATLGANSQFQGNIDAVTSITVTSGAHIKGRALAINGAVTLDTNFITVYV